MFTREVKLLILLFMFLDMGCSKTTQQTATLSPENLSRVFESSTQCIAESGVDPNVLIKIRSQPDKENENENFKTFALCIFKRLGIATKKGNVKAEKALQFYPDNIDKEAQRKVIEECNKETGKDAADTAAKFIKCHMKKSPVRFTL